MFVYVISYGRHSKKVSLDSKDKESILNVFKEKFNHQGPLDDFWIQYKDDDFDMFVDVDDFNNLPDKGILKIQQEGERGLSSVYHIHITVFGLLQTLVMLSQYNSQPKYSNKSSLNRYCSSEKEDP